MTQKELSKLAIQARDLTNKLIVAEVKAQSDYFSGEGSAERWTRLSILSEKAMSRQIRRGERVL